MDCGIENTTVSGIGFEFSHGISDCTNEPVDYQGRRVFKGEEYYVFDRNGCEVYVHIEDACEFLQDKRLDDIECYDILIQVINTLHDSYPIIM